MYIFLDKSLGGQKRAIEIKEDGVEAKKMKIEEAESLEKIKSEPSDAIKKHLKNLSREVSGDLSGYNRISRALFNTRRVGRLGDCAETRG